MDKKEFKQFCEQLKLMVSDIVNRRCNRLIIGLDNEFSDRWIITNISHKDPHNPDPEKREDDFYYYSPQSSHYAHLITLKREEEIDKFFDPIRKYGTCLIYIDHLNTYINKAVKENKDREDINLSLSIDKGDIIVTINMNGRCVVKNMVGIMMNTPQTVNFQNRLLEMINGMSISSNKIIKELADVRLSGSASAISMITIEIPDKNGKPLKVPIPVSSGYNCIGTSYMKKMRIDNPGKLILWDAGQGTVWNVYTEFDDDRLKMQSFTMNKYVYVI